MIQQVSDDAKSFARVINISFLVTLKKLKVVKNTICKDKSDLEHLRLKVMSEFQNIELGGRYIERYLNPQLVTYGIKKDDDTTRH